MLRFRRNACAPGAPCGNYHYVCSALLLCALTACGETKVEATSRAQAESRFSDSFDVLDSDTWGCEYTCPTVAGSTATFSLIPGVEPRNAGSWSKVHYKPRRFTAGSFTVRFALGPRPKEPVWWGIALYDEGPIPDESQYSEIYFGYRTDGSLGDTELLLESARLGHSAAHTVDTGQNLYDGRFHTGRLVYDASHIEFYFDGELLQTISDTSVIPTTPMTFLLGTRLVEAPVLTTPFDEIVDSCEIEW